MNYEQEVSGSILKLSSEADVVIVGIDGLGGAGKSTVSEKLCREIRAHDLHTILLHIDDFIHVRNVRYRTDYPEWQCYYDLQWRYGYFAEMIGQIRRKADDKLRIELYDKDNDCYFTQSYALKEKMAVVVEGIFLQRKELDGIFDYMVYLDVPEEERMQRVLKRDTYIGDKQQIIDKYENRYFPAERKYCREYCPEQSADLVIR